MLSFSNMNKSIAVLYFTDALEADASFKSAMDIKEAFGERAALVPLTKSSWIGKIDALEVGTLCFLATHGEIGEDGTLQAYLELKGLPHTQSSAITSGILANKTLG
jgi:D-alanine-D-alanine ligase